MNRKVTVVGGAGNVGAMPLSKVFALGLPLRSCALISSHRVRT